MGTSDFEVLSEDRAKFIPALLLLLDSAYAEDWVWKRTVGDE